jgi:hypothetical protein
MARCGKGWVDILVRVGSLYLVSVSLYRRNNERTAKPTAWPKHFNAMSIGRRCDAIGFDVMTVI